MQISTTTPQFSREVGFRNPSEMFVKNGIEYRKILTSYSDKIADFLLDNFFPNEPISRALGLPRSQVERWFPPTIVESLGQGCSVMALKEGTEEVVGVAINIILQKDIKEDEGGKEGRGFLQLLDKEKEPVMVEIAELLGKLNQVPPGVYQSAASPDSPLKGFVQTFNCVYLAVLPSLSGKGIGHTLVQWSELFAKERKVAFMQVDTTSEFSYKIFSKCGFSVIREMDLSSVKNIEKIDSGVHKLGRILLKRM